MREVRLACSNALVPRHQRDWLGLGDRLRCIWAHSKRRPLKGVVKVSIVWECVKPPKTLMDEAKNAVWLINMVGFLIDEGSRAVIGGVEFFQADKSVLRVFAEGT